jgi:autotransporter-associated beta strand protein
MTFSAPSTLTAAGNASVLTLTSGGLLVQSGQAGASGFSGGQIAAGAAQLFVQQLDASNTFSLGSYLQSSGGLVKAGNGALSLTAPQYFTGTTTVNGGMLSLGTLNALTVLPSTTIPTLSALTVNGGSFNLNGYTQAVAALTNNNPLANSGGFITSTAAGGTLISATGSAATFGGVLGGSLAFTRSGSVLTLTSNQTFTGATLIRGGGITLRDSGSLSASSGVTNYFGTLTLDDTGLNRVANRITNGISLMGGGLTYLALESAASAGSVTLSGGANLGGANTITVTPATSTLVGGTLNLAGLVRGGAGATVNFVPGSGVFGQGGISNPQLLLSSGSALTNGILGGWATVGGTSFATYTAPNGLAGGLMGLSTYTGTLNSTFASTDNVLISAGTTSVATGTLNSLTLSGAFTVAQTANTTLTIASGGLLATGASTLSSGTLTSGGSELFAYANSGNLTISSIISGAGVSLVKSGAGTLVLSSVNTFGGSTVVNQGILSLGVASALPSGALVLNNAAVTQTVANSINSASPIVINGGGVLTLTGANTLNGAITFNNTGGTTTPLLATTGVLTLGGSITAVNDSFSTTPSITGTVDLGGANRTITTSGLSPIGLTIGAVIQNGSLTKAGNGALVLNAANTFSGSLNLTQGTVILNAVASAGAGTINITDGAKLAVTTGIIPTNAIRANSQFIVGNSTNNLTVGGTLTFTSNTPTITIDNAFQGATAVTTTLNNPFGGSTMTGFTKNGIGTLILNANNFTPLLTGSINIANGILQLNQPYSLGGTLLTAGGTVNLSGGAYQQNVAAGNIVLNPVNVTGSALINTVQANTGIGAVNVANTLTLGFAGGAQTNIFGNLTLAAGTATLFTSNNVVVTGSFAGAGALLKEGVGALSVLTGGNASGAFTVDQGTLSALTAGVLSTAGATVNPAGILRLGGSANFGGAITVNSDNNGLGVLGLAYAGAVPSGTTFSSTGTFGGVLGIDAVGYGTALNLTTLGANVFLGSTQGGNYTAATLGIGTGSTYRLGGGGGALSVNSPVLGTGALVVGAVVGTGATALLNMNSGQVNLNTANSFTGGTTLNGGVALQVGDNGALGTGTITFRGGTLQPDASGLAILTAARTLSNPIAFTAGGLGSFAADAFFGGATDLNLTGNVALGSTGSRVLNVASTTRVVTLGGVLSGAAGLTMSGAGYLRLTNTANSYTGDTTLVSGMMLPVGTGALPTASRLVFAGGALGFWDTSATLTNPVNLLATSTVDVGQGQSLTLSGTISGSAVNVAPVSGLTKAGLGALFLTGNNTYLGTTTINAPACSPFPTTPNWAAPE